jgi:IS1 family transposase
MRIVISLVALLCWALWSWNAKPANGVRTRWFAPCEAKRCLTVVPQAVIVTDDSPHVEKKASIFKPIQVRKIQSAMAPRWVHVNVVRIPILHRVGQPAKIEQRLFIGRVNGSIKCRFPKRPCDGGLSFTRNPERQGVHAWPIRDRAVERHASGVNKDVGTLLVDHHSERLCRYARSLAAFPSLPADNDESGYSDQNKVDRRHVCGDKYLAEVAIRLGAGPFCLIWGIMLIFVAIISAGDSNYRVREWICGLSGLALLACSFAAICLPTYYNCGDERESRDANEPLLHSSNTVPRKYLLTSPIYWGTVIGIGRTNMPNILATEKQVAIIGALAEGSGIRQIERMTGVHRDTIMRLGVRVGKGCAALLDSKMRNLSCQQLQFDEIWGFIGKKERHMLPEDSPTLGDVWTFCAIDADTKLVPSFKVGKRDAATANAFVADVAGRVRNRVQISSDALRAYVEAVEGAFGANVDFAQIVKTYVNDGSQNAERKYSASEFVIAEKKAITGFPNMSLASTSYIERLNGTTRLHMRRLTRLTYAFSKKLENFDAAVSLHFAYYNFVKRHNTLRATPAMAAGIERDFWTVADLVEAAA